MTSERSVEARPLSKVELRHLSNESAVLLLTDTTDNIVGYHIGPEGLGAILEPALGLATKWADEPDLGIAKITGPRNALPANRLTLGHGRNNGECALEVYIGKVRLTFLVPLDDVISAMAVIARNVDPSSGKPGN